jgi:hypothetical protein
MGMVPPMKEDVDLEAHQMQYTSPCCLHQKSHRPSSMSPAVTTSQQKVSLFA